MNLIKYTYYFMNHSSTSQFRYVTLQILFLSLLLPFCSLHAQVKRSRQYDSYINKYNNVAVKHMKEFKIPASITLAQGLLESGAGASTLASQGNNHFGIKCHDWKGATMRKSDDRPNECFRKYKHAEESYHDHSLFLTERSRYNSLFQLQITDYKGWARGLQNAGYATDKAYANKLIKLIEDYELYLYDREIKGNSGKNKVQDNNVNIIVKRHSRTPYITHGLVYVIAEEGDTYEAIARDLDFNLKDLYKYNEVPKKFPLEKGDLVYLEKKKRRADKPYYEHVVRVGESMHSIAQRYGMQVKNLYKMNKKDYDYVPCESDILKLR